MNYFATFSFVLFFVASCQQKVECLSCSECIHPKFQNNPLYLPFCLNEKTYKNLCDALCSIPEDSLTDTPLKPTKGSCEKCEMKCSKVFIPTCSKASGTDDTYVFPNKCHAKCSGMEFEDCTNLPFPSVIPGKTRLPSLPLNEESPEGLQDLENV